MILWRISEHVTLDGAGGLLYPGRWHSAGRPIVYAAEHSALAILEVLVHLEVDQPPSSFQLMAIEAPDAAAYVEWPENEDATDEAATARWGDAWLAAGKTLFARIPSVIAPLAFNWLINPAHGDAGALHVVQAQRWPWDARLFKT